MRHKRLIVLPLIIIISLFCCMLTSCGGVKLEDQVTMETLNTESSKVAVGYMQALFNRDRDLFNATMPRETLESFGVDPYEIMSEAVTDEMHDLFMGIQYRTYNDFTEENGYDVNYMRTNISLIHSIDESQITDIHLEKVSICLSTEEDKKYDTSDVYLVCYKYVGNWYVFEMQNGDAEFAA